MKKSKPTSKLAIGILIALLVILLSVILFRDKIGSFFSYLEARENYEQGGEAFDRNFSDYIKARENYQGDPAEFDANLKKMDDFIKDYKRKNPGATDEEAKQALIDSINYAEKQKSN